MKTLTVEEVNTLDKKATEDYGIPSIILMENAGRQVTQAIEKIMFSQPRYAQILVICGGGNNAGDGFVVARHLFQNNFNVQVFLINEKKEFKGDALVNIEIIKKLGVSIFPFSKFISIKESNLKNIPLVIVDGILGTGFKGKLRAPEKEAIKTINHLKGFHNAKVMIVSIDVPSGINGNTGLEDEVAIHADTTITFIAKKKGLTADKTRKFIGKVEVVDIGIPKQLLKKITG